MKRKSPPSGRYLSYSSTCVPEVGKRTEPEVLRTIRVPGIIAPVTTKVLILIPWLILRYSYMRIKYEEGDSIRGISGNWV